MPLGSDDKAFNRIVRQQLQDLRIDPDKVTVAGRHTLKPRRRWAASHKEILIAIAAAIALVLVLIISNIPAQGGSSSNAAERPAQTSVSLGGLTVQVGSPAFRACGALFSPWWHNADGKSVDGLADPNHVFLALDAQASASIDLQFLVMSPGPFTLRYQRPGEHQDAELPELQLVHPPWKLTFISTQCVTRIRLALVWSFCCTQYADIRLTSKKRSKRISASQTRRKTQ